MIAVEQSDDGGLLFGGEAIETIAAVEFGFKIFSGLGHALGVVFEASEVGFQLSFIFIVACFVLILVVFEAILFIEFVFVVVEVLRNGCALLRANRLLSCTVCV